MKYPVVLYVIYYLIMFSGSCGLDTCTKKSILFIEFYPVVYFLLNKWSEKNILTSVPMILNLITICVYAF